ncbi:hypothetical protein FJT64_007860 [Amphibalanus amphitrite]|uniref:PiggyBac transposable element-derived protein domain-containing protein n=1 Tax=Amphibalanus amphitrite TaxID=1232801 RepID=A0A6A4VDP4_AMPAM|nr:hypothetical protein FJT64_007860 [Amphibalanus amphitrite]
MSTYSLVGQKGKESFKNLTVHQVLLDERAQRGQQQLQQQRFQLRRHQAEQLAQLGRRGEPADELAGQAAAAVPATSSRGWSSNSRSSFSEFCDRVATGQERQLLQRQLDGVNKTVRYLVQEVMGSGRNVTLDRLYTSVPREEELAAERLTVVGTRTGGCCQLG